MPQFAIGNRANSGGVTTTPISVPFTVTDRSPLFVAVTWKAAETVNSVTWNTSEALTLQASLPDGSSTNNLAVYMLTNPTPTTANVVVTFATAPGSGAAVFVIGTVNGDTITGSRGTLTLSDASTTGPGIALDTVAGDLLLHAATVNASTITFDGGESTTSTEIDNIVSAGFSSGFSTKPVTADVTTVGCTDVATYCEIVVQAMPSRALNVFLMEPIIGASSF